MTQNKDGNWETREGDLPSHPHDRKPERQNRDERRKLEGTGLSSVEDLWDLPDTLSEIQKLLAKKDSEGRKR
jgi:hypothetical protein